MSTSTEEFENCPHHSGVARARSNLSLTKPHESCLLLHVNFDPLKLKSPRLHSETTLLKLSIWALLRIAPPTFSS
jgi:hypothetical protein